MDLAKAVRVQVSKETRTAEVCVPFTGIYCQAHGRSHEEDAGHIHVQAIRKFRTIEIQGISIGSIYI